MTTRTKQPKQSARQGFKLIEAELAELRQKVEEQRNAMVNRNGRAEGFGKRMDKIDGAHDNLVEELDSLRTRLKASTARIEDKVDALVMRLSRLEKPWWQFWR